MHRYYAILAAMTTVLFAAVIALGFGVAAQRPRVHVAAGFALVVAVLFVHTLQAFFLIGSGRAVREAIQERPWAKPYLASINRFRLLTFPWALAAIGAAMATAWTGAAAHTGVWSFETHRAAAIACAALNLAAFAAGWRQLRANSRMIGELQARLEAEAAPGA